MKKNNRTTTQQLLKLLLGSGRVNSTHTPLSKQVWASFQLEDRDVSSFCWGQGRWELCITPCSVAWDPREMGTEKGPPRCLHSGMPLLRRAVVTRLWEINQPLSFARGCWIGFPPLALQMSGLIFIQSPQRWGWPGRFCKAEIKDEPVWTRPWFFCHLFSLEQSDHNVWYDDLKTLSLKHLCRLFNWVEHKWSKVHKS